MGSNVGSSHHGRHQQACSYTGFVCQVMCCRVLLELVCGNPSEIWCMVQCMASTGEECVLVPILDLCTK